MGHCPIQFRFRTTPHGGKSQTLGWAISPSSEAKKFSVGSVLKRVRDALRGGASTRRHPKRRASTDQKPGPNIARAAPAAANNSQTDLSPASVRIFQISIIATDVPTMGVHSPTISRIPAPIKSTAGMVTFIGRRSLHSLKLARAISTEPTTTRMRSNPVPGQPPANVEYNRRKTHPSRRY